MDYAVDCTANAGVVEVRQKVAYDHEINLNASTPHDGMDFESKEEAFSFYKEYARSVGFAAIIKASRRSRLSGKFIDAKFVCTRYGNKPEAEVSNVTPVEDNVPLRNKRGRFNRSWSKTDCKACMNVKRRQDGRWIVYSYTKEHNHELLCNISYHKSLDPDRGVNGAALRAVRAREKRMSVITSRQTVGQKKLQKPKSKFANPSGSSRGYLVLEDGDARVMLDFFTNMQNENPNFFYAVDLNEGQRLRNVFWIDAKSRLDYSNFSDVVCFDTTYIRNEYKLPIVPFLGVNNHCQMLLLGCALVSDKTKSTYAWLMQAWLRAMGGKPPRVILTDQDKTLKEVVSEVFPCSRHCFCLWGILSNIPEKLSYVLRKNEVIMVRLNKCIFKSCTNEQFEKKWWKIVDRFNLRSYGWFESLYEDREYWVPLYMKGTLLAGMSSSQRTESVCSFLDKYLQRKTTLKEFLEHYRVILRDRCEEEAKKDFETWNKQPGLKSPSPFGKQMATLYTNTVFKRFQVEVVGAVACHPRIEKEDGEGKTFRVQDLERNQDYVVSYNKTTSDISCSCRLFEFSGFLCRHAMIVLQMSGVHCIPSQYILKRWTKDAKSRQKIEEMSGTELTRVRRYSDICRHSFKLSEEGSLSLGSYKYAFDALEEALERCESLNNSIKCVGPPTSPPMELPSEYEVHYLNSTTKTNINSDLSKIRQVHSEGHNVSIGVHKQWQDMELVNQRPSVHDGYYSSQHNSEGMGQLNYKAHFIPDRFDLQDCLQDMGQSNIEQAQ